MKIFVNHKIEAELDNSQMKNVTLSYLYKTFDWSGNYFIESGKVFERMHYHGSHSFSSKEVRRVASERDNVVAEIISQIHLS